MKNAEEFTKKFGEKRPDAWLRAAAPTKCNEEVLYAGTTDGRLPGGAILAPSIVLHCVTSDVGWSKEKL
jgi:hypothetical protein